MGRDYMKVLYDRFETPSQRASILRRAVKNTHKQLALQLTKPEKKLLLRMADMEDALRDQCCLDSFFAGYRLASGVHRELEEVLPYNFEDEDERNAIAAIRAERREGN